MIYIVGFQILVILWRWGCFRVSLGGGLIYWGDWGDWGFRVDFVSYGGRFRVDFSWCLCL